MIFGNFTILIRTGVGLGDALMLSCVASEIKKQFPNRKIITISKYPKLFVNNPNVYKSLNLPSFIPARFWYKLNSKNIHCINYENIEYPPKNNHILELCCKSAKLAHYSNDLKPEIFISDDELRLSQNKFKLPPKYCVIHSECGTDWFSGNKDWGHDNWQEVIDTLTSEIEFIQLGSEKDERLNGTTDLRGKTTIRELACIIKKAQLFIGQEGGLNHIAASVNTKGIIIMGGMQPANLVSYSSNIHFSSDLECSPCWLREKCPYDKKCMSMITSEMLIKKIKDKIKC